jgi:ATP-binding cassette subfamily B protein/subfamily B ATP-binding cassette protein MsbA
MLKWRKILAALLLSSLVAAIFEGGTMGILGLAVSVLVEEQELPVGQIAGSLGLHMDRFITSTGRGGIFLTLIGIAVIAQIIKSALLYISQISQIYLSMEMRREIQRIVVDQIMSMSYSQVSEYPPGSLASFIDQSQSVQDIVDLVSNLSRATLMLLVYGGVMFWVSPTMSLISLGVIAILWAALTVAVRRVKQLSIRATKAKIFLLRWTVEFLNAPRLLRIFNSTNTASELINKARDSELIPERNSTIIDAAIKPTMEVITIFGAGAFLILGYLFAGESAIAAIPGLFVFVLVFYRLKPQIQAFSDVRIKLARILPRLEVVEEFISQKGKDYESAGGEAFSGFEKQLSFKNVSFRYLGSETNALQSMSFSLSRGETVALVGPSGAGKSTVADLLLGLYKPTEGSIEIDGRNLQHLNVGDWREHIGVVDQQVFLLNASVRDNIAFARPGATLEDIKRATRTAHAHEFIEKLKNGYDTIVGERGYMLSGGQQQRLALARALLRNPDILILDEATSALDTLSERLIQKALDEMHSYRTILVIAHRLSTVMNADQIIVLDNGQIIEYGTREELIQKAGKFAQLWNLQIDNLG